ncbi:MAG: phosphatidate cytidylyltransferase [Alistipes sp.]|nr:phosphatidate cytidylyltransferase [Alistipes sp.]
MSDKLKNFIVRTISGVVMFAVVLGATLASKWSFGALVMLIAIGGVWEFYRIAQRAGYAPHFGIGLAATVMTIACSVLLMITMQGEPSQLIYTTLVCLPIATILLLPAIFICELYTKSETPIANIGSTIMGYMYVALPMALLPFIPSMLSPEKWQPWIVIFYIFIIWANDVFAYLFGITLGKHRLFERISPKKSWEGFFGGLLGAMAMGYVAALILNGDVIVWIGLALVAALSGVFGDLVESLFKRSVDVKDSGNIIPGHGGWLDRFDALIFSLPFVFIYLVFISLI